MNSYHGERIDCVRAYKSLYITSIDVILIHIIYKAYNQYKWINI
uniref:ORF43a n=1 Tax=Pinus thunbergii TaxID=3350 RepID=Q32931_PINTH|nr:ORF43a [Pinus thunbergii]